MESVRGEGGGSLGWMANMTLPPLSLDVKTMHYNIHKVIVDPVCCLLFIQLLKIMKSCHHLIMVGITFLDCWLTPSELILQ